MSNWDGNTWRKRGSGWGERERERRKEGRMMTAPGSAPLLTKAA